MQRLLARVDKEKSITRKRQIRRWKSPEDGATAVYAACSRGYTDAARMLLDAHFGVREVPQKAPQRQMTPS